MKYEYYEEEKPKVGQVVALLTILAFIIFGLYIIGIVWTVHEVDKNVVRTPTPGGSMVIEGATPADLPLQGTVNGGTLNTGGYDGQDL